MMDFFHFFEKLMRNLNVEKRCKKKKREKEGRERRRERKRDQKKREKEKDEHKKEICTKNILNFLTIIITLFIM